MHAKFRESFRQICLGMHALFVAAVQQGETKDFERLQAFTVSQHYSRFAAGLIVAVNRSGLAKVDDYPNYEEIQKIAEQPSGFLSAHQGEGLKKVLNILGDEMESQEANDGADDDSQSMAIDKSPGWKCPCCNAAEVDVNMEAIGTYNLAGCTSSVCWCKTLAPSVKYCKLCVNYVKRWHVVRKEKTEVKRKSDVAKRKSLSGDADRPISAKKVAKKSETVAEVVPYGVLCEVDDDE
jgi:hypothetical protein